MAGLDGRGPLGEGPATGRGLGNCNVSKRIITGNRRGQIGSGYIPRGFCGRGGAGFQRGFRRGFGGGFGKGYGYQNFNNDNNDINEQNISKDEELRILQNEAGIIKQELSDINKRIEELKTT